MPSPLARLFGVYTGDESDDDPTDEADPTDLSGGYEETAERDRY